MVELPVSFHGTALRDYSTSKVEAKPITEVCLDERIIDEGRRGGESCVIGGRVVRVIERMRICEVRENRVWSADRSSIEE